MKMKFALALTATLASALVSPPLFAQAASAPLSRADVKAETRAAAKDKRLTPPSEGDDAAMRKPATKSTKTRADRKAETLAAAKAKQLTPPGEGDDAPKAGASAPKSTKTRAERKAETAAAAKAKQLTPAGEGNEAPKK